MSLAEHLHINPDAVSRRIFFGKESIFTFEWHVFDAALHLDNGATISLHDRPVFTNGRITGCLTIPMTPQHTADSLRELETKRRAGDHMCDLCFKELELAAPEIARDRLLRFE